MRIGVVADDLTGAADAVAPFAGRGRRVHVLLPGPSRTTRSLPPGTVVALDTETRSLPVRAQDSIRRRILLAVRRLRMGGHELIYKKIDSTLRGHLRLELDTMVMALPERLPVICPAFPATGRTMREGVVRFEHGGAPVERSVRAAFEFGDGDDVAHLSLTDLGAGAAFVHAWLLSRACNGTRAVLCDAADEEDLSVLARAVLASPGCFLPVASGGLARALAAAQEDTADSFARALAAAQEDTADSFAREMPASPTPAWTGAGAHTADSFAPGASAGPTAACSVKECPAGPFAAALASTLPTLAVVGSVHPVSRAQLALLAGRTGTRPVVVDFRCEGDRHCCDRAVAQTVARLQHSARLALLTTPGEGGGRASSFADALGQVASRACLTCSADLVVTGGETAWAILRHLGARALDVIREVEPGVVATVVLGSTAPGSIRMITKAGGFGDAETLLRCLHPPI